MGVTKFNSAFVANQTDRKEEIKNSCACYFLDGNIPMYPIIDLFILKFCQEKNGKYYIKDEFLKQETAEKLLDKTCKYILEKLVRELDFFPNLEEIHIAMDGTPCYGKIQQQLRRRKTPRRIYKNDTELFFSDAMAIPGTILTNTYKKILSETFEKYLEEKKSVGKNLILEKSLCEIPGEGEHKILDMVRRCKYANYSDNEDKKTILIDSNDSDTIISIIHQQISFTYVKTDVVAGGIKSQKIVSIASIRETFSKTKNDIDNFPLLIAFAGNDFLPEMLDSLEIKEMYSRMSNLCRINLTEVIKIDDEEVRVINFKNLMEFVKLMSANELDIYHSRTKIDTSNLSNPTYRDKMFNEKLPETNFDKILFKKRYYKTVYENYCLHVLGKMPDYAISSVDETSLDRDESDIMKILAKFEKEMTLSYLKTYVYYYYYQSGFKVGKPLDNSYYPYGFPPLYNSIYLVLLEANKNNFVQFSHEVNPELIPKQRENNYFEKLPIFEKLHHYMVLQDVELISIYGKIPFDSNETDRKKSKEIYYYKNLQTRFWQEQVKDSKKEPKRNYIELYPRIDIQELLEKFPQQEPKERPKVTITGDTFTKLRTTNFSRNKYAVAGSISFE